MIIKLTELQITNYWELIKDMLHRAYSDTPELWNTIDDNILRSLLTANKLCWMAYKTSAQASAEIVGVMITEVRTSDITGIRSLEISSIGSWETLDYSFYQDAFTVLCAFGRSNNCSEVSFYSSNQRVLNVATRIGFNLDSHYVTYAL